MTRESSCLKKVIARKTNKKMTRNHVSLAWVIHAWFKFIVTKKERRKEIENQRKRRHRSDSSDSGSDGEKSPKKVRLQLSLKVLTYFSRRRRKRRTKKHLRRTFVESPRRRRKLMIHCQWKLQDAFHWRKRQTIWKGKVLYKRLLTISDKGRRKWEKFLQDLREKDLRPARLLADHLGHPLQRLKDGW